MQLAGVTKRASYCTLRSSFARHLREDGYDIHTLHERLGDSDVSTTMVYTHVLNRGRLGVKSPADRLELSERISRRIWRGLPAWYDLVRVN